MNLTTTTARIVIIRPILCFIPDFVNEMPIQRDSLTLALEITFHDDAGPSTLLPIARFGAL
jgi:hypothetical protein